MAKDLMRRLSRHFEYREFACKCRGCDKYGYGMDLKFIDKLEVIRHELNKPMIIFSGERCEEHNHNVRGAIQSRHLYGIAADIACRNSLDRLFIIRRAFDLGMSVGIAKTFLHLDDRKGVQLCFTY